MRDASGAHSARGAIERGSATQSQQPESGSLSVSKHLTRRFLIVGLATELFFAVCTGTAFTRLLQLDGLPAGPVLFATALAHALKDACVSLLIIQALRPIERWQSMSDGPLTRSDLERAVEAAYRAPRMIALAWCVAWTLVYPAIVLVLRFGPFEGARPSVDGLIASALMAVGVSAAALSLSYTISGQLMAPTAGALSLLARERGVPLRGHSLSLRSRLVILMFCLAIGPTVWMSSLIYMNQVHRAAGGSASWVTLALFALTAMSWGPFCAFFLTGALAQPLRNIGAIITQLVTAKDPRETTLRAPIYYRDEVGDLAEGVNEMTDRLTESAARVEHTLQALDDSLREAQEAVHARDEFLSIAGHELRTPLTSLGLTIRSLERRVRGQGRPVSPEEMEASFRRIGRQLDRFQVLVQELLDVSRIVEGRLRFKEESFDLTELVGEVVSASTEAATHAHCSLSVHSAGHCVGSWDRMRMEQVVTNLISNAIKFGGGKPVEIELEADEHAARLRVRDYGIGISTKDQARIFERFERAVSMDNYGGLGLGLWISQQIVDAMGGRITVESRLREGSIFSIEVPRHGRSPEQFAAAAGEEARPRRSAS